MRFRPCIDLHEGTVKQIVGATLSSEGKAEENFVSTEKVRVCACAFAGVRVRACVCARLWPTGWAGGLRCSHQIDPHLRRHAHSPARTRRCTSATTCRAAT